uniref:Uncharacterized protein n=1 Tax=Alexandrium catenella TaxID=2925 RepID=A0A7S1R755_ALECA
MAHVLREHWDMASMMVQTTVQTRQEHQVGRRALGVFVGWIDQSLQLDRPLWDVARDYRARFTAASRMQEHIRNLDGFPPWYVLSASVAQQVYVTKEALRACCTAVRRMLLLEKPQLVVSNRGAFSLSTPQRSVTSVHFFQAGNVPGPPIRLSACTVNGALSFGVTFQKGVAGGKKCADVADELMHALSLAAGVAEPSPSDAPAQSRKLD